MDSPPPPPRQRNTNATRSSNQRGQAARGRAASPVLSISSWEWELDSDLESSSESHSSSSSRTPSSERSLSPCRILHTMRPISYYFQPVDPPPGRYAATHAYAPLTQSYSHLILPTSLFQNDAHPFPSIRPTKNFKRGPDITRFPSEIFSAVLEYIRISDLLVASHACRAWRS
ncbi:hypothetical protein HK405_000175, partial [Cladochytrium tenue]